MSTAKKEFDSFFLFSARAAGWRDGRTPTEPRFMQVWGTVEAVLPKSKRDENGRVDERIRRQKSRNLAGLHMLRPGTGRAPPFGQPALEMRAVWRRIDFFLAGSKFSPDAR